MKATKLTLTVSEQIITKAKKYAKQQGRSLSDLIENYLHLLTMSNEKDNQNALTPLCNSLKGSFSIPDTIDYKEEISNYLEKKYLN